MHRRIFLQSLAASAGALSGRSLLQSCAAAEVDSLGENRPLLKPGFQSTILPWSAATPRQDNQLIFPLSDERLMLVNCQHYNQQPAQAFAEPTRRQVPDETACRIVGKISPDRGRSWSEPFTLQDNIWKINVKHPNLVRLPSGEILFFFVGWDSMAQRNVFFKRSADECNQWSEMQQISEPGCNFSIHGRVLTHSSGRVLLPAYRVIGGGPFRDRSTRLESFVYYSDDGFATWRQSAESMTIAGRGAHEPTIVELRDGRLMCLLRNTQGYVYQAFSSDQGDHWTQPEPTRLPGLEAPSLLTRLPKTGELLVVWNNRSSALNTPRTPLSCAVSTDEGRTWGNVQDIHNDPHSDAAYCHIFFQDDEALLTHYLRKHESPRACEVVLKIFDVEQFRARQS